MIIIITIIIIKDDDNNNHEGVIRMETVSDNELSSEGVLARDWTGFFSFSFSFSHAVD